MKRILTSIFCFIFVFSLSLSCFAEDIDIIRDLLSEGFCNPDTLTFNGLDYNYNLYIASRQGFRYFEIYFNVYQLNGLSMKLKDEDGSLKPLTIVPLGDNNYKAYYSGVTIYLNKNSSIVCTGDSNVWISVLGIKGSASLNVYKNFSINVEAYTKTSTGSQSSRSTFSVTPSDMVYSFPLPAPQSSLGVASSYDLTFSFIDLPKYDLVDFYFYVQANSIGNISCSWAGTEISYTHDIHNYQVVAGTLYCHISVDLTNVPVNHGSGLIIHIQGLTRANGQTGAVTLISSYAYATGSDLTNYTFYQRIGNFFTNLSSVISDGFQSVINSINGVVVGTSDQQQKQEQFNNSVQEQNQTLLDAQAQMDSVEKPNINADLSSIEGFDSSYISNMSILVTPISNNRYIKVLFSLCGLLALVSFALFGKKG